MKIIDASWELRNLGKRTVEITLDSEDIKLESKEVCLQIDKILKQYSAEYIVVKIRTGNPYIGDELCKRGFMHIETQIHLKSIRKDMKIAVERYEHFFKNITVSEICSEQDLFELQTEIRKGIFQTDRIALDPHFGVEIANNRYANWLEDELKRGSHLFFVCVKGNKVGFFLDKYTESANFGLLAGTFINCQGLNQGGGGKIHFAEILHNYQSGCKVFVGSVSSNNIVALKILELLGGKVDYLSDVYVKHYFE